MDKNESLPVAFLDEMGFRPCACKNFLNPAGQCFEPKPELGTGYYWFYEKPNMYAVGLMDLTPREDFFIEYMQSDFIAINYYDAISAEELSPYKRLIAHSIRGHVAQGDLFRCRTHANMPVRGIELMLMPGFYHDYLEKTYPGEFPHPEQAFASIDGSTDFPELVLVLKQIAAFMGEGMAADLYYQSKVIEAVSLIINRTKTHAVDAPAVSLSAQDRINLDAVKSYIEDHFAYDIKADQLATIACMGQTKLRANFKQAYGSTITEYIQNHRIAHAEFLLTNTDFTIAQVALAVGYHHAGRFSSLFKKLTGLYPDEYRHVMR